MLDTSNKSIKFISFHLIYIDWHHVFYSIGCICLMSFILYFYEGYFYPNQKMVA